MSDQDMGSREESQGNPAIEHQQYVNEGTEDQMEIQGYIRSPGKTIVCWSIIIMTCGFLRLFFAWFPHLYLKATHRRCSLDVATAVLLKDQYLQQYVSEVEITVETPFLDLPANSLLSSMKSAELLSTSGTKHHTDESTPLLQSKQTQNLDVIIRSFVSKKVKYLWLDDKRSFEKLRGLEDSSTCDYLHQIKGLNKAEQLHRRNVYGENRIDIRITPLLELLFTQVLSPFYMFQFLASVLWILEWYYYYAGFLIVISIISIIIITYQTRTLQKTLRSTVDSSSRVTVFRSNKVIEVIPSDELVPGDVIEIPGSGCTMQCDAVLITGNCIVNESMLTGESTPITKTPLPNPRPGSDLPFSITEHARHVLFCGTKVMQTRYYGNHFVRAVVLRIGYSTAKGELVRSILFPKPLDFKFKRDTYVFLVVLGFLALSGFIYTIVLMTTRGDPVYDMILAALDLITIAVPPALPAALTIGTMFAQRRLKSSGIFCISPNNISVSGTLNVVCFDKTGTLTEEGLNFHGVLPVESGRFTKEVHSFRKAEISPLIEAMASCHSLTYMDNVLTGDPIDLIMFQATKWEFDEQGKEQTRYDTMVPAVVRPVGTMILSDSFDSNFQPPGEEVGIIRQFPFSSKLQRMSVITRRIGQDHFDLFCKGAPETIASLSKPETIPTDLHDVLSSYTQKGYRVLAIAWNELPPKLKYAQAQRIQREQVERNLTFLGLVVFENRVKPLTNQVICELTEANIRTLMVTGDNMLTAMSVARECGMIKETDRIILVKAGTIGNKVSVDYYYTEETDSDLAEVVTTLSEKYSNDSGHSPSVRDQHQRPYHFALDGYSWAVIRQHFPDLVEKIVVKGTIFARMSPEQKTQLVESLQDIGYYVGMCGDGANDCGALKTAHSGISLSDLEASVASSFTYKNQTINCVPLLIREGRAALVTSMGIFKYMAMYSLTMFVTVCILYWINANMTDFEFLYIDLILLTSLSATWLYVRSTAKVIYGREKLRKKEKPDTELNFFIQLDRSLWQTPQRPSPSEARQCGSSHVAVVPDDYSYSFSSSRLSSRDGAAMINANMTDFEFLYIDLILLTSLSATWLYVRSTAKVIYGREKLRKKEKPVSWTGAYGKLHKDPPLVKLVSVAPVTSLLFQTTIVTLFQVLVYLHVMEQPWFYPFEWNEDYDYTCYEANALFVTSSFQYVATSIAFSIGKPYRKSIASNYPFLISLIVCISFNIWFTVNPGDDAEQFMQLLPPPSYTYRLMYLGLAFINSVIIIVVERYLINSTFMTVTLQAKLENFLTGNTCRYLAIEKEMNNSKRWPPIPKRTATTTEMFGTLDNQIKIQEFESSILSSFLDSSCSSYLNSLHSTSSLAYRSDSFHKNTDWLGSFGKKLDTSSMGAIYPYLTEPEEFNLPFVNNGKIEGFINHYEIQDRFASNHTDENLNGKENAIYDKLSSGLYESGSFEYKEDESTDRVKDDIVSIVQADWKGKENKLDSDVVVKFESKKRKKEEDVSDSNNIYPPKFSVSGMDKLLFGGGVDPRSLSSGRHGQNILTLHQDAESLRLIQESENRNENGYDDKTSYTRVSPYHNSERSIASSISLRHDLDTNVEMSSGISDLCYGVNETEESHIGQNSRQDNSKVNPLQDENTDVGYDCKTNST